ncbi:MAG: hypothetical protein LBG60_03890 [Bifidobacteriaceae bacterium]|nr:hypothetical protein [Bifidobacteriaceae bacterium]
MSGWWPHCQPARRREVDHVDPFDPTRPASEQTVGNNMQHVCKARRDLKTSHGWECETQASPQKHGVNNQASRGVDGGGDPARDRGP